MMSIRFRFTLLYTLILALTLTVFGGTLYTIQAQDTLNSLKGDLSQGADKMTEITLKNGQPSAEGEIPSEPPPDESPMEKPPKPLSFNEFSGGQEFQKFREREIVRVLDADGNLVASPFGRAEDALPLSAEGLQVLQSQREWWESGFVSDEEMLIYSRPIVRGGELVYIIQVARSLTERNRTLQSLATTLLAGGSLTVLLAFGIGWLFSGLTLQPIHRITQTASKIGEERDFSRRVDYTGPQDEVGQLANTFNSMLARLQDAFQKVEHSLEMQRDFVADVSHELRTPLTTLRGNLGLLRRKPPMLADEQADILNDMVDESDRLIRLVNDLLLLARADAGRSLVREPLELSDLLDECCRQARQLDPQRKIQLEAKMGLKIIGDRDALKQVTLIALDNALKHSTGDIQVTAQKQEKQVEIRLQDFGEGIPPEKLEHVFDRFYRGDDSTIPGFGLGLPIARTLVEGMDGEIVMESKVGKGSVVILRFAVSNVS